MKYSNYYKQKAKYYDLIEKKYFDLVLDGNINFLEWVFEKYLSKKPSLILEVACGTGVYGIELAKQGYQIFGVDISPEMLSQYQKKIDKYDLSNIITLAESDLTEFTMPKKQRADAAFALYNELYELPSESDLQKSLENISNSLCPGGIFVFSLEDFGKRESLQKSGENIWETVMEEGDIKIKRIIEEKIIKNDFYWNSRMEIEENGEKFNLSSKSHYHIWGAEKIYELLEISGFNKIDIYGSRKTRELFKEGDRFMIFVAKKES